MNSAQVISHARLTGAVSTEKKFGKIMFKMYMYTCTRFILLYIKIFLYYIFIII